MDNLFNYGRIIQTPKGYRQVTYSATFIGSWGGGVGGGDRGVYFLE